jgi:uncharacterized protein (DUF1800 family)
MEMFSIDNNIHQEIDGHDTDTGLAQPQTNPAKGMGAAALAAAALAACGGGGGNDGSPDTPQPLATPSSSDSTTLTPSARLDVHRFLTQTTFGPTKTQLNDLTTLYADPANADKKAVLRAWLKQQFELSQPSPKKFYDDTKAILGIYPGYYAKELDRPQGIHLTSAWWKEALIGEAQLRHRVAFALSEILVISLFPNAIGEHIYMAASYYDMLYSGAFGSYRQLVEDVAKHPAMGNYLSHLKNDGHPKDINLADVSFFPDQNFAREIMQLFTIGLHELNQDGTKKMKIVKDEATGEDVARPIDTYTQTDIEVLAHVFTGWTWQSDEKFNGDWLFDTYLDPNNTNTERHQNYLNMLTLPMRPLSKNHALKKTYPGAPSISLLGKPLPIKDLNSSEGDINGNFTAAMDILFAHPNVAPFIATQMIQRLVTSNPSGRYVADVAAAFQSSNFDLKKLVEEILLHDEARNTATVRVDPTYGKLKEPVLRMTQFLRAFDVKSYAPDGSVVGIGTAAATSGYFIVEDTLRNRLGQGPFESPSVFNFFKPGYVPPATEMGKLGKNVPEMQICGETEVALYARCMQASAYEGFGQNLDATYLAYKAGSDYWRADSQRGRFSNVFPDLIPAMNLLQNAQVNGDWKKAKTQLIEMVNDRLFGGAMTASLSSHLDSVFSTAPANTGYYMTTQAGLNGTDAVSPDRAKDTAQTVVATLLFLCLISPEFVVQR